ncbi:MAG: hypothetical protein CMB48_03765 [Euryarchaeota archaeon]|nr:hypothetical protein [Euryarchaeota archaeon]
MAKQTEQRILVWLNQFDDSLQDAWDVPRENSLPGIADAIGVVRSALHTPLKNLQKENMIIVKQAHVINGGSRKRNVHFITEKGRKSCKKDESVITSIEIKGNPPNNIKLIGREKEMAKIDSVLSEENSIWVSGIAGIGKTSIIRNFIGKHSQNYSETYWYTATSISSPKTIVETWLGISKLSSQIEHLVAIMENEMKNNLFVIDNFEQIDERFKNDVIEFILKLSDLKFKVIISSRPPLPNIKFNEIEIFGLEPDSAKLLLQGFEKLEVNKIVEYFDGHPLGITMVNEEMSFESTQKDINSFLQNEILAPLTEENLNAIYELAIQPEPIEIKYLFFKEQIENLDNLSLIKYYDNKVFLHNFVKNLLISQMEEEKREELHYNFTKQLSKFSEQNFSFLRLFHEIHTKKEIMNDWVRKNADKICNEFPAKASALFHNMISKNRKNGEYYWFASISECELGNWKNAKELIKSASELGALEKRKSQASILNYRIARLSGEITESEKLFDKIEYNDEYDYIKFIIAEISRKIDDRIPDELPNKNSMSLLQKIDLNSLNREQKRNCLIAMAIIKHTFSLYEKDFEKAEKIRSEITEITSNKSEVLQEMIWKKSIVLNEKFDFETNNLLRNIGLICWKLEFENTNKSDLLLQLKSIINNNLELENRPAGRRAIAIYWTWLGILEEEKRPFAWTQAIGRWNSAECYNASNKLQKKLHEWLIKTGRA